MPIDEDAANFLKYAFTETKDLAKHFLTVVIGVLVLSLTFAENIVTFKNADRLTRGSLGGAWCCFFAAIVSCGIAICFVALSGGAASSNGTSNQYWKPMRKAIIWLGISGSLFVFGLMGLMVAASMSAFR